MPKHVSDGERLVIAALNKRETQLKQSQEANERYRQQLKEMKNYVSELKESNKILAAQVKYLVSKQNQNA